MKNYYDILEIAKDASADEIKRAYFKLVKQCTPEKDPEGFKNLRTAYETLKDDIKRKAYDQKQNEDIPEYLVEELQLVNGMLQNLHTKEAIATLEYLARKYPTEPKVASVLGETYLYAGSSGKAVKYLEQVAGDFAQNQDVQFVLAKAYDKRGYHNKAYDQFNQVIALDRTNATVWLAYINYCDREYNAHYRMRMINEALAINEEMFVDDGFIIYAKTILENLDNKRLFSLVGNDFDIKDHPKILRYLDLYIKGIKQHGRIPEEQLDLAFGVAMAIKQVGEVVRLTELMPYLEAGMGSDEDFEYMLAHIKESMMFEEFFIDDNVLDVLKSLIACVLALTSNFSYLDNEVEKFEAQSSLLMAKTGIVSEIDRYREGILYLRENYPVVYAKEKEFLDEALNPAKVKILENKLQSDTMRFFKKHPRQLKQMLQDEGGEFDNEIEYNPGTTYVRQTPKTGRNDPCPCGSGKKYKRCCG